MYYFINNLYQLQYAILQRRLIPQKFKDYCCNLKCKCEFRNSCLELVTYSYGLSPATLLSSR